MKFVLYRGRSLISSLIQWQTRSVYSHVAIWFPDAMEVYEAVDRGFVRAATLAENHDAGTEVDVLGYEVPLTPEEIERARAICGRMVGAPYDYEMVFAGFVLRMGWEPAANRKKFFCDEAALLVATAIGHPLVARTLPWKCSPEDVNKSVALRWERSMTL